MKLKTHLENNISAARTIQIQFEHEALQSKMKQLTLLSVCDIIIRNKNSKIVRITYEIEFWAGKNAHTQRIRQIIKFWLEWISLNKYQSQKTTTPAICLERNIVYMHSGQKKIQIDTNSAYDTCV